MVFINQPVDRLFIGITDMALNVFGGYAWLLVPALTL